MIHVTYWAVCFSFCLGIYFCSVRVPETFKSRSHFLSTTAFHPNWSGGHSDTLIERKTSRTFCFRQLSVTLNVSVHRRRPDYFSRYRCLLQSGHPLLNKEKRFSSSLQGLDGLGGLPSRITAIYPLE
jgi:hypothetical protein